MSSVKIVIVTAVVATALAFGALVLTGCSDVMMAPGHSAMLDSVVISSADDAARAKAGTMDANEMTVAIDDYADFFKLFQDARDGVDSDKENK